MRTFLLNQRITIPRGLLGGLLLIIPLLLLTGCSSNLPRNQTNVCMIFRNRPQWYWASLATEHKWGVPIGVQMAIIHEESHFRSGAVPPREKLLGLIPWLRPTTARGYAQAVDATWRLYLKDNGKRSARRTDFATATDFIGWYANLAHQHLGISLSDADAQYLAYHEGLKGYRQKLYRHKPQVIRIANHVQAMANNYQKQLLQCSSHLSKKPWWRFWS